MIEPHIVTGVQGHAVPICVISEGSHVDRAMFNCIAHILFDRPCETTEEIDEVWEIQMKCNDAIMKLLKCIAKPVKELEDRHFRLVEHEHK